MEPNDFKQAGKAKQNTGYKNVLEEKCSDLFGRICR